MQTPPLVRKGRQRQPPVTAPARIRLPVALVVAVILAGALQRWWVAAHPMGTLTSDGAVIGLMALRLLHHGHLTAYMWGQSYGGSVEAIITAAVFGVAGSGTSQLLAATALSSALAALALWRAGRWILGETAAQIGALIFWVWPATFLWRSLKPGGTYMAGLAIALCAVGALARIRRGDDDGWRRCAIAGLWCGLALWSTPMGLELLIPAGLWCLPAVRRLGFRLLAFGAGAAAGWLPALVFGLTHDWTNLHMPGERADLLSGALSRFRQFFRLEAPIAMGVRAEGSFAWVGGHFGEFLAWPGAAALLATAVAVLARRAPRCVLPVLTLVLLPFLYAFIELADNPGQGRYALFAVPMAALLLGAGTERIAVLPRVRWPALAWTAVLALACGLGTAGLAAEPALALVALPAPDVPMPVSDAPLRTLLAEHGVTDAYATYWIAYRVMFETGGRVTVAPYDYDRYPPINAAVSASPDPAFLFVTASRTTGSFEAWCRAHGVAYQAWQLGGFTVVRPAVRVNPAQALPG